MAKYKPQHSRMLFIDRKVKEGKYPNCSSLAEEYEVSRKTIQRDIEYMRYQLDAPIKYVAKHRGYIYTEEQFQLPAIKIKESDLFGVYLAEKLLVQYEGTPIYNSLCSVFEKIEQALPNKMPLNPAGDQTKFTVYPPFATTINPDIWKMVTHCLRSSKQLKISYKTPGNKPTKRFVDPYHIVRFEGDWYLVGRCYLRDEIRTFSLSRIILAKESRDSFKIPTDFDFSKLSRSHFGVHWSNREIKVAIRFSKRVADYVKERAWHQSQTIKECKNGDIILSLTVSHLLELKRWILSWGSDAQVLNPTDLADSITRTLHKSIEQYS